LPRLIDNAVTLQGPVDISCSWLSLEYEPELLLADRKDLRRYHLLTKSYTLLIDNKEVEGAIAMDFHFERSYVYWTDVTKEQIMR